MIFPTPKSHLTKNGKFIIENTLTVKIPNKDYSSAYEFLSYGLRSIYGIDSERVEENADIEIILSDISAEEYTLDIVNNGILIGASDIRGAIYAFGTTLTVQVFATPRPRISEACTFICPSEQK